jgi:hypothetical protein
MEIQEVVFYYLHEDTNILEIQFRLTVDSEEEIRIDHIDLMEADDFGYNLVLENFDFDDEDEENDFFWGESASIDEDNLIEFLNEYYIVKPDKLPKPELI